MDFLSVLKPQWSPCIDVHDDISCHGGHQWSQVVISFSSCCYTRAVWSCCLIQVCLARYGCKWCPLSLPYYEHCCRYTSLRQTKRFRLGKGNAWPQPSEIANNWKAMSLSKHAHCCRLAQQTKLSHASCGTGCEVCNCNNKWILVFLLY